MKIELILAENDPLLKMDFAVVKTNLDQLVFRVRDELLKQAAMNYPKGGDV